jgi:hypothetical protein
VGKKAVHERLVQLGPGFKRFDALVRSPALLDLVGKLTGIPGLLYDPEYYGGGTHENLHGQELDSHVDFNYHPTRRWHRRLNLIIYLNHEWHEAWGGSIDLHTNPWDPEHDVVQSVLPLFNRCVLFETSERSWHGFRKIALPEDKRALSRRSVALYFYTRERPPAETFPAHATFYVHRPLPEHLRAGHTLTDADVAELKTLFARRDGWIKFLYQREMEFGMPIRDRIVLELKRRLYSRAKKLRQLIRV